MNDPSRLTAAKTSAARSCRTLPPYVVSTYEAVIEISKKT